MSRFIHIHVADPPGWRLVEGRNRCTRCGFLVERAWKYYANPTTWSHALCEPCAHELVEETS